MGDKEELHMKGVTLKFKTAILGLLYYSKLYCMIVSQYIKTRMQYRADFFVSIIGIAARSISGILPLLILFKTIPDLQGYSYDELVFMYGFALLAATPVDIFFSNVWQLHQHLIEGTFIKYYFRPLNVMFYYFSEVIDIKAFSQLAFAIVIVVYSSISLAIKWTVFKVLMLLLFCTSSFLILASIMILSVCTGFWFLNCMSVPNFIMQLNKFSQYPLTIFNSVFRFIFTFVIPIGFVAYYPMLSLLRGSSYIYAIVSPIIGIGLFALANAVWNKGIGVYSGTGS